MKIGGDEDRGIGEAVTMMMTTAKRRMTIDEEAEVPMMTKRMSRTMKIWMKMEMTTEMTTKRTMIVGVEAEVVGEGEGVRNRDIEPNHPKMGL